MWECPTWSRYRDVEETLRVLRISSLPAFAFNASSRVCSLLHLEVSGAIPSYTGIINGYERITSSRQRTKVMLGGARLGGHLAWGHNLNSSIDGQMVARCVMSELSNTTDSGRSISNTASLGRAVK